MGPVRPAGEFRISPAGNELAAHAGHPLRPRFVTSFRCAQLSVGELVVSRNFFSLWCEVPDIDQETFLAEVSKPEKRVAHKLYRPPELSGDGVHGRAKVRGVTFWNVSFSKTTVVNFEFTDCTFYQCLFVGTVFENCRFTRCSFDDSNPHRIEFIDCFVDPRAFISCIRDKSFANIGVYLFQELLRNSRRQVQPEFVDTAQFWFYRWRRHLIQGSGPSNAGFVYEANRQIHVFGLWLYELICGSGTSLKRLSVAVVLFLASASLFNWHYINKLGLRNGERGIGTFIEASYLSIATTLGFGELSPGSAAGHIFLAIELVLGFIGFALLTSTIFRRISA